MAPSIRHANQVAAVTQLGRLGAVDYVVSTWLAGHIYVVSGGLLSTDCVVPRMASACAAPNVVGDLANSRIDPGHREHSQVWMLTFYISSYL